MKMLIVAGARPNFMKIAPLIRAIHDHNKAVPNEGRGIEYVLVHTGQHYDIKMSEVFFNDLELPRPHVNLEVGSASHAVQTASIMIKFEEVCLREKPDWILVVGDVNSTMACTLVAAKLGIKVGHVEAGLRSFDRTMPEEINRIVTDALADLLFTPSEDADENLRRVGVSNEKIHMVGNIMIDSLDFNLKKARARKTHERFGLKSKEYALVTLHRPANTDNCSSLKKIMTVLEQQSHKLPILFPMHPRTQKQLSLCGDTNLFEGSSNMKIIEPMGYLDFVSAIENAKFVLTDSGGLQEETTYLGIPCLTLRENTERPVTVQQGTNKLTSLERLEQDVTMILHGMHSKGTIPYLWDGQTGQRVISVLLSTVA